MIGFEKAYIPEVVNCRSCNGYNYIEWMATDTTSWGRIDECKAIFAGYVSECYNPTGILFDENDPGIWSRLKLYVEMGGRLYVAGEYRHPVDPTKQCMTQAAMDQINRFMTALGSEMQLVENIDECDCPFGNADSGWPGVVNTDPNLLLTADTPPNEVTAVWHSCTGEVSGGTWVAKTYPGSGQFPYIAIEYMPNPNPGPSSPGGYIMLAGDSNITVTCPADDNCPLWRSFIEKPNLGTNF